MKKLLLSFFLFSFTFQGMRAQSCEPDTDIPEGVLIWPIPYLEEYPASGIPDTACANTYFETVFTIHVPPSMDYGGITVPISSVDLATEGAILNLPEGFDYSCNPSNCIFASNTSGCLLIYGTAPNTAAGVYDLKITALFRSSIIDFPATLPDGVMAPGNYFLVVQEEGSAPCIASALNEIPVDKITVANRPNPFSSHTEIIIGSGLSGLFEFTVTDLLGKVLKRRQVQIIEGENILPFDAGRLPEGIYLYAVSDGKYTATGKMVVNRF